MKKITINSPKYGVKEVLVDDSDYDYLMQWKWQVKKKRSTFYAARVEKGTTRKTILMHRVILGETAIGFVVDHIDHNGLNNKRTNLRACTPTQNNWNRRHKKDGSHIGVYFRTLIKERATKNGTKTYCYQFWYAKIYIDGKQINIGSFKTENEAATAYNEYALKHRGEFASLNVL